MRKTEYLFGIQPNELDDMEYWSALSFKLKTGTQLFKKLYKSNEDDERLFHVNKAMIHTRELIGERDEC